MNKSNLSAIIAKWRFRREESAFMLATLFAWSQLPSADLDAAQAPVFWDANTMMTEDSWRKILGCIIPRVANCSGDWAVDGLETSASSVAIEDLHLAWNAIRSELLLDFAPTASWRKLAVELLMMFTEGSGRVEDPATLAAIVDAALNVDPGEPIYCFGDETSAIALFWGHSSRQVRVDVTNRGLGRMLALLAVGSNRTATMRIGIGDGPHSVRGNIHGLGALIIPPFGLGTENARPSSSSGALDMLQWLLESSFAKAVVVIPDGFLSRTTSNERAIKQQLIEEFGLCVVVTLRKGIMSGSMKRSVLIHEKSRGLHAHLYFVNGRGNLPEKLNTDARSIADANVVKLLSTRESTSKSCLVPLNIIATHSYNIAVDRHLVLPEIDEYFVQLQKCPLSELKDLAEITRPPIVAPAKKPDSALDIREVANDDIQDGVVMEPAKVVATDRQTLAKAKAKRAFLGDGDILLSVKGRVGVVGMMTLDSLNNRRWVAGQSFVVLRILRNGPISNPAVLAAFLQSDYGQSQIVARTVGTTVPAIQIADVKTLSVPILKQGVQLSILKVLNKRTAMLADRKELDRQIADLTRSLWVDVIDLVGDKDPSLSEASSWS